MASNNSLTETTGFCNSCHGPSAAGHLDIVVTVLASSSVEVNTPTTISATIQNNGYQFNPASLTLQTSPVFTFTSGSCISPFNSCCGRMTALDSLTDIEPESQL